MIAKSTRYSIEFAWVPTGVEDPAGDIKTIWLRKYLTKKIDRADKYGRWSVTRYWALDDIPDPVLNEILHGGILSEFDRINDQDVLRLLRIEKKRKKS